MLMDRNLIGEEDPLPSTRTQTILSGGICVPLCFFNALENHLICQEVYGEKLLKCILKRVQMNINFLFK